MCIAVYKPKTGKITRKRLEDAYNANPDGCGMVWFDGIILHTKKGCYDFDKFYSLYSTIAQSADAGMIIHFRTASSGSIDDEHCHPFFVNDNLAFVENGNLFEFSNFFAKWQDKKTDVQRFNEHILQRLPDNFLANFDIRQALEEYCRRNFTKMIFMDNYGKVDIINEAAGEWIDGAWYSNGGIKYYNGYGYSGAYYYNPTDVRHKGGRINKMLFPLSRRDGWKECSECNGYFYKLEGDICLDCGIFKDLLKHCADKKTNYA